MKKHTCWLAVLAVALLSACNNKAEPGKAPQATPPTVKIAQPLAQTVTEWDEFTGHIEAVGAVDVRARVSGYLEKVNFTAGTKVKKGDLLFVIDPKPYQAQLNYAEAERERAQARWEQAQNDWRRAERLFQAKAIATEEYDTRRTGLHEAAAAVKSAEANVYTARINLDYTQVYAPIDGRIGRELVTVGNLVSGDGTDATRLTFMVSTDPVYLYADADERSALKYRRLLAQGGMAIGQTPLQLAVADETGFPHQGKLDYLAPRADSATGTVSLRGVFANPDGLLSPGFFARLRVRGSLPYPALLLPDKAIATDQAQRFVWVINAANQTEYRKVGLGAAIGQTRVITDGLQPGDWVVVEGLQKLKPGITVTPERTAIPANQTGQ